MKTTIYIDGYNLYYGSLHGGPYKWRDVVKLCNTICKEQQPASEVITVKYFTAPVKAKVSTHGQQSLVSQSAYHKALKNLYPSVIEIISGYFIQERGTLPRYKKPIQKNDRVEVWRLEEKKTDVNIAMHMYRDVVRNECDQIVLVSNDSDIVPSLEFIRKDYSEVVIGSIMPRRKVKQGKNRVSNKEISDLSNWTRQYVLDSELENSQLPDLVPTKKKPAYKPDYW
jgi:uncharacterized LabA/DUF88 family protein